MWATVFAFLHGWSVSLGDDLPKNPQVINQLVSLSPEQARNLVKRFKGDALHLNGLATLSAETAEALVQPGTKIHALFLNGVVELSPDTATGLAEFHGGALCLHGLPSLSADVAHILATSKARSLQLDGITRLDAETAEALCGFRGTQLTLRGLTWLDADTARALAGAQSWLGHLPRMTSLSADVAGALVTLHGGVLHLEGLTMLDAATARVLSRCRKWSGNLPNITSLEGVDSVAVAEALAERQGPLALARLTRLSPRTLAALVKKPDVIIPPLESLELIREPDGGPNDDFLVPKEFPDRRKRPWQQGRRAGQPDGAAGG